MTDQLRMSPTEFEQNQDKLTKVSVEVNKLARLIMVDGLTQTAAAAALGMSKQNAFKHMKRVKALLNDVPPTWVLLEAQWMPGWLAEETRSKLRTEKEKIKKQ
ncbi:TrfB-related DNA-binding protein [Pseudomonas corrugata]|uniref:TrfB-related DNA-binding protein n=1 Tax=Pseudomonas corrugata TaxID=47879 RepID=UPI0006D8A9F5|nr:TrfB-related DNA-binding protein [Pseudomonas corrugata]